MTKPPLELSTRQIIIEKVKINYTLAGTGQPLVLIHGNKHFWESFIKDFVLNTEVKLIALSPPGYDQLKDASEINTLRKFITLLDKLFLRLNLENITISGLSLGAIIALLYAAEYPQKVSKLLLLAPPFSILGNGKARLLRNFFTLVLKSETLCQISSQVHKSQFINYWTVKIGGFHHLSPIVFKENILPAAQEFNSKLATQQMVSMLKINPFPLFERIAAKTAIIVGERDPTCSIFDVQKISQLINHCQLSVIPHTKHALMLEKPKELSQVMTRFLLNR